MRCKCILLHPANITPVIKNNKTINFFNFSNLNVLLFFWGNQFYFIKLIMYNFHTYLYKIS